MISSCIANGRVALEWELITASQRTVYRFALISSPVAVDLGYTADKKVALEWRLDLASRRTSYHHELISSPVAMIFSCMANGGVASECE